MSLLERSERIERLVERAPKSQKLDSLVFSSEIPKLEFERLKAASLIYLSRCLGKSYVISQETELMEELELQYSNLSNLTPNGKVMPKPWLNLEYNLFLREFACAIKALNLDPEIEQYRLPTLRYKAPANVTNPKFATRPYATEKMHTERWISNKNCDSLVLHVLLFGDTDHNHVRFYRTPQNFDEQWMRPIQDFNEVRDIAAQYKPIDTTPQKGRFYCFEGSAVHSTNLSTNAKGRVSIEMFAILKQKLPNIHEAKDDRLMDYCLPPNDFHRLGDSLMISVKDTMSGVVELHNMFELR